MEVKPGYKQTEVGVIPEEWDVVRLFEVVDLQVGFAFKSDWFGEAIGTRLLRGENVGYGTADWSETRTLKTKSDSFFHAYALNPGDVVVGMDRTFTKTGVKITMLREHDCPCLLVQRVGRFIPRKCNNNFLWLVLSSDKAQSRLRLSQKGMDIPHLSRTEILHPLAAFPQPPEQGVIAGALSDVDALLGALDELIAKQRDLKQAAMQQLLTGKTRLPGFNDDWEVKRLGTLLRFQVGFPFSSTFFNDKGEGIRLIKNRDLKTDDQIFHFSGKYDDAFVVHNGDVLVGMDGDFIPCRWDKGFALLNQRVGRIVPNAGLNGTFAFYHLIEPLKMIELVTSSTTVKHLSHGDIEDIECPMPDISEQTAIAEVLSDMDAELAALEQRRAKTRALKQGMMQELLTGRTRLV